MDIINNTTKDVCKLKYFQYSYFSKDAPHKVTGVITDANGQARWVLTGSIENSFEILFMYIFENLFRYLDRKNRRRSSRTDIGPSRSISSYGNTQYEIIMGT